MLGSFAYSLYPEELLWLINTIQAAVDFGSVIAVLILKICLSLFLWRFFHWKLALFTYLTANVFGMDFIIWVAYEVFWAAIYFLAFDVWWSSCIILVLWALHEFTFFDLPQVGHWLCEVLNRLTDVTGDRKFDFEDIKVIAGWVGAFVKEHGRSFIPRLARFILRAVPTGYRYMRKKVFSLSNNFNPGWRRVKLMICAAVYGEKKNTSKMEKDEPPSTLEVESPVRARGPLATTGKEDEPIIKKKRAWF